MVVPTLVAVVTALAALSQRESATGPPAAARSVAVFPSPATPTASPRTQVTVRGAAPAELRSLLVRGSRTGRHAGRLVAHSDGQGASFVPARPFAPGERVTVRAPLPILGARGRVATFRIARAPTAPAAPARAPPPQRRVRGAQRFRSRPDLHPPGVAVRRNTVADAPGSFFVSPKAGTTPPGTMIVDGAGRLVWWHRVPRGQQAYDFRAQTFHGRPVATWWQGRFLGSFGAGEGEIYDAALRRIARVRAGNGYRADLHEFLLTPRNTALLVIYDTVRLDLSAVGGRRGATVLEGVVQEVDVDTGAVLFEWHSLRDVPLRESYMPVPRARDEVYDYVHINSVALDADGDLLVSGRHTHAVYKIDRESGRIRWRLGGRRSSFRMGPGAAFRWQHDARRRADGALTLFDNRARQPLKGVKSRALVLRLDETARTATVVQAIRHPRGLLGASQGNVQALPDGGMVVGWGGRNPVFSQFDARGRLVFDARFRDTEAESYRAYRLPWSAQPGSRPALAVRRTGAGMVVFASWNGDTGVAAWRVVSRAPGASGRVLGQAARTGFETPIRVPVRASPVAVQALDASGRVLATSRAAAVGRGAG